MSRLAKAGLWLCVALLCTELLVRASRIDDVPVYRADNRIGYIPAPNQTGAFLWTRHWSPSLYRDDSHPSPVGMAALARIIVATLSDGVPSHHASPHVEQ